MSMSEKIEMGKFVIAWLLFWTSWLSLITALLIRKAKNEDYKN